MTTPGEGGATATFSNEGGGGEAGGKFRKRPRRSAHQTTPYDRPPTAIRGINTTTNENDRSWLTKLVVVPASKLISYGANRFFSSVFRKRLPPPPPHPPVANNEFSVVLQEAAPDNQSGAQEAASGNGSHPINCSDRAVISELEQLLKRKTFTRPEIERLMELLRSKAVEVPLQDDPEMTDDALPRPATELGRHLQFSSTPMEKSKVEDDRSHGVISTPIVSSKVIEDEIASPAELAKAYMGSRPSKVSPSMLGMHNQGVREDSGFLSNVLYTSKSSVMPFTMKNAVKPDFPGYGFTTPRSRGRSSLYNMAHTPYSRVHPTASKKGTGFTNTGYGGPSTSSSQFVVEHDGPYGSNKVNLKRRSSLLDDDLGSIGPVRRIRQKPSLLSHRIPVSSRGVEIVSDDAQISSKHKLPLEEEPRHEVSKNVGENEYYSNPSTSYAHVPSKSREVAARILQHLENLTPKEKSSESKPAAVREKLPSPSMLHGLPFKTLEDANLVKLLQDVQNDHKLEDWPKAKLPDARYSTSQKNKNKEEDGPKGFVVAHDMLSSAVKVDTSVLMEAPSPIVESTDSGIKTFESQPPQKLRSFRMSAHEDVLEQDDNFHSNGIPPPQLGDWRGTMEKPLADGKPSPAELKLEKTTILKSTSSPSSSKRIDMESSGAIIVGEGSTGFAFPASQAPNTTFHSTALPQSVSSFDKPKEVKSLPPLFNFSSKNDDVAPSFSFQSLPFELSSETLFTWSESEPESSSSLVNVLSTAIDAQPKNDESDRDGNHKPLEAGEEIGKSETVPSDILNGSVSLIPPALLSTSSVAACTNQIPTSSFTVFTPSTSIANFGTSGAAVATSSASSSCLFGSNMASSFSAGPVCISVDPSSAVSATSAALSEPTESKTEEDNKTNFDISSFFTNTGSSIFGLGSLIASSTANHQSQSSLFGTASGSPMSGVGTVSQSTPVQLGASASSPSFNVSSSNSFGSSLVNAQGLSPNTSFGFSSDLAFLSETSGAGPGNEPTSSLFNFGASSSDVSAVSSSIGAASGTSSIGVSSFSYGSNAVGIFNFGSYSTSIFATNTSSSSSSTSVMFGFGGSSSALNSVSSSNAAASLFSSSWQSPKSSTINSTFTTPSPSTGFIFGESSSSFATNTASTVLDLSAGASPAFSFTAALSSPSLSYAPPAFGNQSSPFAISPGNNDQVNTEDSMAEDPIQQSTPSVPTFGQPPAPASPPALVFGSTATSQASPFQFGGQQTQVAMQNPPPLQASDSLDFNASGSFSLGSGGGAGDKSGRKIIKVNRNRNRKK